MNGICRIMLAKLDQIDEKARLFITKYACLAGLSYSGNLVHAYEDSSNFAANPKMDACPHYPETGGFTVIFESGFGRTFTHKVKHMCAKCLPKNAINFSEVG